MTNFLIKYLPKDAVRIKNRFFLSNNLMPGAEFSGLFLGQIENKEFVPSLSFLELLNFNSIIVNDKAAWLFSCQRDILQRGIVKKNNIDSKNVFLVKNEEGDVLGLAEERGSVFSPIFDCGYYLRREFTR
jgi:ribosome biogenesis protein Nip4